MACDPFDVAYIRVVVLDQALEGAVPQAWQGARWVQVGAASGPGDPAYAALPCEVA